MLDLAISLRQIQPHSNSQPITNNSVVDQSDVAAWLTTQLNSTEVGNCSLSKNIQPFPSNGTTSLTITSSDCSTLLPNRPYTLVENLEYFPTQAAPSYTSSIFYTQAKDPKAINPAASVTHCSATRSRIQPLVRRIPKIRLIRSMVAEQCLQVPLPKRKLLVEQEFLATRIP